MTRTVLADTQGEKIITAWLEKNVGKVVKLTRQGRWRPAWFADVEVDGKTKQVFVRGERPQVNELPLRVERECQIHQLVEKGGVKVAHVYGFIPEIPAMVMDTIPGQGGGLRSVKNPADQESVRKQVAHEMAKMHRLDTAPFEKIGLTMPKTPRDIVMNYFDFIYNFYKTKKRTPDPRIEFQAAWANRNVPKHDRPARYIAVDAGQFMADGPELTAMIDLELSLLGDYYNDLAALRIRGQWEPIGDIPSFYKLYEQESGEKLNLDDIRFHTVLFGAGGAIGACLMMDSFLQNPTNDSDYFEYLTWIHWEHKQGLEAIAELTGYEVPELKFPDPIRTQTHEALFALRENVKNLEETSPFITYQKNTMNGTLDYLERVAAYGARFDEEYISGAEKILKRRPKDTVEADELLDAYVQQAGPEDDERLFRLIHTDVTRRCFLLATPNSLYHDGLIRPLLPIY